VSGSAGERIDTGGKLGKRKRLYQIIVAARLQPFNPVVNSVDRGQEQDGCLDAGAADRLDDRQAVEPGEHPVNDQHIVRLPGRQEETVSAVRCAIDDVALLSEPLRYVARGIVVVFDDEDLHRPESFGTEPLRRLRAPRHNKIVPMASGMPEAIGSTRAVSTTGFEPTVNITNGLAAGPEVRSTASSVEVAMAEIR